ncbi:MAG: hypothetical protein JXR89_04640 [Deltaproteobacteria bacterium]|nr:hypothetical protein [Deltaproteobacteria bacterium]
MGHYRRSGMGRLSQNAVDPGKDLFAYLFILVMVFTFMLLMTTEERRSREAELKAPRSHQTGNSRFAAVENHKIGHLEKNGSEIKLVFAGRSYHPWRDLKALREDGRISRLKQAEGGEEEVIYLAADNINHVSLAEYFTAFRYLGEQGINIAFAEKLR